MKKSFITLTTALTLAANCLAGGQSFKITTNTLWSSNNYPVNNGNSNSFAISTDKTLTIDQSNVSCYECSFTGGNIAITTSFTCQSCTFTSTVITMSNATLTLQSSTNTFSGVTFTVSGTGELLADAAMTISNSTFTFNNSAELFNNGGTLTITSSTLYFNNSSYLLANAGPVNLENGTDIFVGNGVSSSTAYIKLNGPTLNIYDNSGIALGNNNNYYFNWSSYYSAAKSATVSTLSSTANCGGNNPNSCSNPLVYGPESITGTGLGSFGVLPIMLTDFSAALVTDAVELSWTTEQEENSSYFDVQRSVDGNVWENIGTVTAKGNSSTASNYSFNDEAPVSGINYYRLKMVNTDNSYAYSGIKVVKTTATRQISFFPNPATSMVNITLADEKATSVELMNIAGQVLAQTSVSATNGTTVSFNVAQYARGMYVIRVVNADGTSQTTKLAVTH